MWTAGPRDRRGGRGSGHRMIRSSGGYAGSMADPPFDGDPGWARCEPFARRFLQDGLTRGGLLPESVWVDYLTLGGGLSAADLTAVVAGQRPLHRRDHDLLAHAVNERLPADVERVPYSDEIA